MFSGKQVNTICGLSDDNLLENLKVSSQEVLEVAQKKGRSKCPKCNSSRMFYCYTCHVPVESVPVDNIPSVKLPVKIDIIKHPNETDGKSTAVHAKLLAHEDVTVYTFPCIPDYENDKHEVILVFPSPNSVSLKESLKYLTSQNNYEDDSNSEPSSKRLKLITETNGGDNKDAVVKTKHITANFLKRVVFIDSTWNQANKIISDERLQGLLTVELTERKTCFWRHQKGTPDTYLSTIEAIYYFMVDYHVHILEMDYHGEYDNLLFFFSFMYRLVKNAKHSAGKLQHKK